MKKGILIPIIISLIVVVGAVLLFNTDKTPETIKNYNEICLESTCAPFKDICHDWRATAYGIYKYCEPLLLSVLALNDSTACKKIKNKEIAVYCLSLATKDDESREECLNFAGETNLSVICHLTDLNHILYQNWDNGKHYILDCNGGQSSNYYGTGCETFVWQEDETAMIYPEGHDYDLPRTE